MLPIKVTPIAEAHIQEAASWWLANRDKAPLATNYAKCNTDAMAKSDIDIGRLSPAERLELIEDLWNSLTESQEALTLTDAQREELDRRIQEMDRDAMLGEPWKDAVKSIRERK